MHIIDGYTYKTIPEFVEYLRSTYGHRPSFIEDMLESASVHMERARKYKAARDTGPMKLSVHLARGYVRAASQAASAAAAEYDGCAILHESAARRIASEWHGGQFFPLYALSSTGTIVDGAEREIEDNLRSLASGKSGLPVLSRRFEKARLNALLRYVQHHNPKTEEDA
jgi:hypothetical protein